MIPGSTTNTPSKDQKAIGGPHTHTVAAWGLRLNETKTGGMGLRGSLSPNQNGRYIHQAFESLSPAAPVSSKAER